MRGVDLELQLENYQGLDTRKHLTGLDREAIAESVIHRFETCYDTLWKDLKRYLIEELGLPNPAQSERGNLASKRRSSGRLRRVNQGSSSG